LAAKKQTYVVLLRAINVGGRSVMRMADLRKLIESLGYDDVTTYIQTGNVVFATEKTDPKKLASAIEAKVAGETGHTTMAFVLTPAQLKRAAERNPFAPKPGEDHRSHLMFLDRAPGAAERKALLALAGDPYSFEVHGKVLYYAYPNSAAGNRGNIDFERILGVKGTGRTWKVVDKLIELSA
jgi:uncharacterized protein (DUF1697 family)